MEIYRDGSYEGNTVLQGGNPVLLGKSVVSHEAAPDKPSAIFGELAYSLAEAGFASLRYGKRGGRGKRRGRLPSFPVRPPRRRWSGLGLTRLPPEVDSVFAVGQSEGTLHTLSLAGTLGASGFVLLGAPVPRKRGFQPSLTNLGVSRFRPEKFRGWDDYTTEGLRAVLPNYSTGGIRESLPSLIWRRR